MNDSGLKNNEDSETVTLTAMPDTDSISGSGSGIERNNELCNEIMETTDNTVNNNNEMVTVLQQQLVQMPRAEAYRLGTTYDS